MLIKTLLWLCSSALHCVTPCCVWSTEPEAMPQKTIKKQTSQSQSLKDRWVCVNSDSSLCLFLVQILFDPMLCLKHRARGNAKKTIKKQTSQSQSLKDRLVCVNSDSSLALFLGPTLCDPMLCLKHRARGNATQDKKKQTSQSQSLKDRLVCANSDSSLALFLDPTLCDPMLCLKHRARGGPTKNNKKQKIQSESLKDWLVCVNSDSFFALFLDPTCPVQILLCLILPDYSDSKGALADSEHISNSDHFLWPSNFGRVLRLGLALLFVYLTTPVYMQGKIFLAFWPWT